VYAGAGDENLETYYTFVRKLVDGLSRAKLDYAFTGALAASFYGIPRTTSDVDVMVSVTGEANVKSKVADALRYAGVRIEERKIDEALESGYNITTFKSKTTPYTVDVIFSNAKLEKQEGSVAGRETFFQTPESLILAKLRMIKATVPRERALKDEEDVRAILNFAKVDVEAVEKRARKEGTLAVWKSIVETR
jgi:hypothetical protein